MSETWISIAAGIGFFALSLVGLPQARADSLASRPVIAAAVNANANGQYFTSININNSEIEAIVDTGASVVALSWEDAQYLRINTRALKFNVPISTANGMINAASVTLDKVEVDGIVVSSVDAVVMPEGALEKTLLGMSYLSKIDSFHIENGVLLLNE